MGGDQHLALGQVVVGQLQGPFDAAFDLQPPGGEVHALVDAEMGADVEQVIGRGEAVEQQAAERVELGDGGESDGGEQPSVASREPPRQAVAARQGGIDDLARSCVDLVKLPLAEVLREEPGGGHYRQSVGAIGRTRGGNGEGAHDLLPGLRIELDDLIPADPVHPEGVRGRLDG